MNADGDLDDDPLSNWADYQASDEDQEMTVAEDDSAGHVIDQEAENNPGNPAGASDMVLPSTSNQQLGSARPNTEALASAVEMRALTSPALALTMAQIQEAATIGDGNGNTNEEKIQLDAYQGVMQGLHMASRTLSDGYQLACLEVQGFIRQSLDRSTHKDHKFIAEVSTALCQWVEAIQPAIDCLDKSVAKQSRLLEDAWRAGMQITEDILGLYSPEDKKKKEATNPLHNLTAQAFDVAQKHVEDACMTLHLELPALVHQHVPLAQAGVFLAAIFQIMCTYWQETDNMVLDQTVMLAQVVPNMWGVWQGVIEGLSLLGPPTCPDSWPASLVERVDKEPAKRTTLAPPVTLVKGDSGKTAAGSSGKRSLQKQIPDFWNNPEREREEEESQRVEEEKHRKKSSGSPILSLAKHEEPVSSLVTKTTPNRVSQPVGLPSRVVAVAPKIEKDRGKTRRPSPNGVDSSDDKPLADKPKSHKQDYTSPDVVVVDDDLPLSSTNRKTPAKKAKTYMDSEQRTIDRLNLQLKSEGRHCQYSKELADLIKYWNENVPKPPAGSEHRRPLGAPRYHEEEVMVLSSQGKFADHEAVYARSGQM